MQCAVPLQTLYTMAQRGAEVPVIAILGGGGGGANHVLLLAAVQGSAVHAEEKCCHWTGRLPAPHSHKILQSAMCPVNHTRAAALWRNQSLSSSYAGVMRVSECTMRRTSCSLARASNRMPHTWPQQH